MLLEELEWKLGGRIKSVLIIVLVILFMWYAGGNHTSAAAQYFSCYIKCWEMLCFL